MACEGLKCSLEAPNWTLNHPQLCFEGLHFKIAYRANILVQAKYHLQLLNLISVVNISVNYPRANISNQFISTRMCALTHGWSKHAIS